MSAGQKSSQSVLHHFFFSHKHAFDVGLQLTKQKAIRERYSRCFKSCNIYGKFSKFYRNAIILDFVQLILQFFH